MAYSTRGRLVRWYLPQSPQRYTRKKLTRPLCMARAADVAAVLSVGYAHFRAQRFDSVATTRLLPIAE